MSTIERNFEALARRIDNACRAAGRERSAVTLIGASKTMGTEQLEAAAALGLKDFGENYLEEALVKIQALVSPATWHFIGRIQSNKTRQMAAAFDWIHTVDRVKVAHRLAAQCPPEKRLNVLIQVNLDDDPAKAGANAVDAAAVLDAIAGEPTLIARGLMTILARATDPVAGYESVAQLHTSLASRLSPELRQQWNALSMGMTADLEAAIAAGATHIRIGTALFGARLPRD